MRLKILDFEGNRLVKAVIIISFFTALAAAMSVIFPFAYFRYLDFNREYIHIDLVTYNKKVFYPCEEVITSTHYKSEVDTRVNFSYQVYRVVNHHVEPLKGYKFTMRDIPVVKTPPGGRTIISNSTIPCDFPTGVFFTEGIVSFEVRSEPKHALYKGDTVTIESRETGPERRLRENE